MLLFILKQAFLTQRVMILSFYTKIIIINPESSDSEFLI